MNPEKIKVLDREFTKQSANSIPVEWNYPVWDLYYSPEVPYFIFVSRISSMQNKFSISPIYNGAFVILDIEREDLLYLYKKQSTSQVPQMVDKYFRDFDAFVQYVEDYLKREPSQEHYFFIHQDFLE